MERADCVSFFSYTGAGINGALAALGALDIVPVHYSELPRILAKGFLAADVVLLRVPPPDGKGRVGIGLANEYLSASINSARAVIVEIDESLPHTRGRTLDLSDVAAVIRSESDSLIVPSREPTEIETQIADRVSALIEDESTLQLGVGSLPNAIAGRLTRHQRLGIHSGVIGDGVAALLECGAADNSRKQRDTGITVAGVSMGSKRVLDLLHTDPQVEIRETEYTHSLEVLASLRKFVSVNSAIEVDLSGQLNAEVAGGRYLGAVGGAIDFARGARKSVAGTAIIALPSTARGISRIVSRLSGPVSTARSDVAVIVTEFGVADLRGRTMREREEAMIAIAHPDHRTDLEQSRSRSPSTITTGSS
jgi:acetyl-CoA hydrolase